MKKPSAGFKVAGIVDVETMYTKSGEQVKVLPARRYQAKDKGFAKVFKTFAVSVLRDLAALNSECRVLMWFLAQTVDNPHQSAGWLFVPFDALCEDTGLSDRQVRRSLAVLKHGVKHEDGHISKPYIEQQRPRSQIWRIKPEFVFVGVLKEHVENGEVIRPKMPSEEINTAVRADLGVKKKAPLRLLPGPKRKARAAG